jgi:hypothetical protein
MEFGDDDKLYNRFNNTDYNETDFSKVHFNIECGKWSDI